MRRSASSGRPARRSGAAVVAEGAGQIERAGASGDLVRVADRLPQVTVEVDEAAVALRAALDEP